MQCNTYTHIYANPICQKIIFSVTFLMFAKQTIVFVFVRSTLKSTHGILFLLLVFSCVTLWFSGDRMQFGEHIVGGFS